MKVYDVAKACSGYSWQGNWYPHAAKEALTQIEKVGRMAYQAERDKPASTPPCEALAPSVTEVCTALSPQGWWLRSASEREREVFPADRREEDLKIIDTGVFVRNAHTLLDYLENCAP